MFPHFSKCVILELLFVYVGIGLFVGGGVLDLVFGVF